MTAAFVYIVLLGILCCCGVGYYCGCWYNSYLDRGEYIKIICDMADSEDEVDKRNVREKFKPERNDYDRHESRRNDVTDR